MITIKNVNKNTGIKLTAQQMMKGDPGGYYVPVLLDGVLTWVPSEEGMPTVQESDIRGPQGPQGVSGVHVGTEAPEDENTVIWIDLEGGGVELEPAEGESY